MELKKGYKQTDIGVIPKDWEVTSILDICRHIFLGLTAKVDYVDIGGFPLIRATDIAKGKLDLTNVRTISTAQHKKITRYKITRRGDLLVSKSGSLGVCALVQSDIEFSTYESIITISPNEKLNSNYLLWLMRDERTQNRMIGGKVGSSVSHLNIKMFRELKVPFPIIPEQRAIAQVLSDTDALIQAMEEKLDKKRAIKQGAMQRLLTPGEGWEVDLLESLVDVIDPHPSHRAPVAEINGIPFLGIGDLNKNGEIIKKKFRRVNESIYDDHKERYDLNKNLIGLGRVASIGKVIKLKNTLGKYTISPTLGILEPKKVNYGYLYYILNSKYIKDYFSKIMSGSTRSSVGMIVLRRIPIPVPPTEEQNRIATILSDMDAEIEQIEEQLAKYQRVKTGLMQELLTGRIRLV